MSRPPHLCNCGRTVAHGTRCQCQIAATRARNARHDAKRPTARQRGYSRKWEQARTEWLFHHPCCAMCGKAGATVVDHIIPHRGDEKLFWDWRNWQSLCARCHNSAKQRLERRA
ncbi:MAG: nuclease / probable phage holin-like protein [Cypionkella sp.]|uniref:HNH endonuclease n=1 Tax=Cypionkella sp. TaxID=2811411 RepID=UPI00262F41B6|nr:HNH endonuclease signature motif containing protein [Cypionkella sp.]MDB5659564.1 nuclease / probable phage holin-like protein [Cypionkella sp.]